MSISGRKLFPGLVTESGTNNNKQNKQNNKQSEAVAKATAITATITAVVTAARISHTDTSPLFYKTSYVKTEVSVTDKYGGISADINEGRW